MGFPTQGAISRTLELEIWEILTRNEAQMTFFRKIKMLKKIWIAVRSFIDGVFDVLDGFSNLASD